MRELKISEAWRPLKEELMNELPSLLRVGVPRNAIDGEGRLL